jgi:ABC-type multidrug transport system fused ATPase/permease subunit
MRQAAGTQSGEPAAVQRRDAKLIILDEPTAALDPQSESVVYRRFIERVNNQTAVLISHRLGATKFAGRILVFEKGRIVEEGNHADLMARWGTYYAMYTAQAGMYKE